MKKTIDPRFVGKWKGSDQGKIFDGEINSWVMQRKSDGTFEIFFETYYEDGTKVQTHETGIWYVSNGIFYEYRDSDEDVDSYHFEFLSSKIIQFIEVDNSTNHLNMFVDYKLTEN